MRNTGSHLFDKQWQLRFHEFSKSKQDTKDTVVFQASQNERNLTNKQSQSLEEQKAQERETGQSVLMLGQVFHEKVLFIKKQLSYKQQHPLRQVIEKFKSYFEQSNVMLLCKSAGQGVEGDLNSATYD